jgi:phosphoribosylamine--glycine ligase
MTVLIVGAGGREHALAWKLKQSPKVHKIFISPGNAGTALVGENINAKTQSEILGWLRTNPVDLVVIGPDNHLVEGLTDAIKEIGIKVFGPTKAAAKIEWSKSYAKQFMLEEGIPTARHRVFETAELARDYVQKQSFPIVIKADGLAAGKGVIIAGTVEEAEKAITEIMETKVHGESGACLVIEDFLEGFEISVHAFCDGEDAVMFPSSKDHKRIFDGDKGPNTGGMGTIAPVPIVPQEQMDLIRDRIVLPTLAGLKKRGHPFKGILFPGIMLTKYGPQVIEFNARFGDPETQSYMRILESDLLGILLACVSGSLKNIEVKWSDKYACCVVLASAGYPGTYEKGFAINLPADSEELVVFHAGTALRDNQLVTDGGRVLGVTAIADTVGDSLAKAFRALSPRVFEGVQYRNDIGTGA